MVCHWQHRTDSNLKLSSHAVNGPYPVVINKSHASLMHAYDDTLLWNTIPLSNKEETPIPLRSYIIRGSFESRCVESPKHVQLDQGKPTELVSKKLLVGFSM